MLEPHSRSVVAAGDAVAPVGARSRQPNPVRAGVTSVLQELPHKDPGVRPVAPGLVASALKE